MHRKVAVDKAFGARLREAMTAREIGTVELAARVLPPVRPGTVSRWRKGERPDDLRIPAIANVLLVEINWLRSGQGPRDLDRERLLALGLAMVEQVGRREAAAEGDLQVDAELIPRGFIKQVVWEATAALFPYVAQGKAVPVHEVGRIIGKLSRDLGVNPPESGADGDADADAAGQRG